MIDPASTIRRVAVEEGVDPNILLSIWQQESSGSTDLGLRGSTLQSGHYARGPFQIMSFHGEIPGDFEGQARWAARHLKERGVRGYYGTGKAPAGFPTTDQYERQVLARAGRSDAPVQSIRAMPQPPQSAPVVPLEQPMYEMQPQGPMDQFLADPITALGASLLAQAGGQSGAVGRGMIGGIAMNRQSQRDQEAQMYRRLALEEQMRKRNAEQMRQAQWQQYLAQLPPELQAAVAANPELLDKIAERQLGLNLPWYVTPNGGIDPRYIQAQQAGATQINLGSPVAAVDDQGNPVFIQPDKRGGYQTMQGVQPPGGNKLTEDQGKSLTYAIEALTAEQQMADVLNRGSFDPSSMGAIKDYYASDSPFMNWAASEDGQQYFGAARNWIANVLYGKSGAQITAAEFERGMKGYIPQPFDKPERLKQKAESRRESIRGLKARMGEPGRKQLDELFSGFDPASAPAAEYGPPVTLQGQTFRKNLRTGQWEAQ